MHGRLYPRITRPVPPYHAPCTPVSRALYPRITRPVPPYHIPRAAYHATPYHISTPCPVSRITSSVPHVMQPASRTTHPIPHTLCHVPRTPYHRPYALDPMP